MASAQQSFPEITVEEDENDEIVAIVLRCDMTVPGKRGEKNGRPNKNVTICTTGGFTLVPGTDIKIGLNIIRP